MQEVQIEFGSDNKSYLLCGRPFGIALVWSNAYLDSRGTASLNIADDRYCIKILCYRFASQTLNLA